MKKEESEACKYTMILCDFTKKKEGENMGKKL